MNVGTVDSGLYMTPEEKALELYPPKYIRETWTRRDPDINAPLREAFLRGCREIEKDIYADLSEKMLKYSQKLGAISLDEIDYDIHLDPALEGSDHSEIVEFYVVGSSSPCSEDPNKSYRCITMIYELKDSVPCFTAGDKGKLILKIDNKEK